MPYLLLDVLFTKCFNPTLNLFITMSIGSWNYISLIRLNKFELNILILFVKITKVHFWAYTNLLTYSQWEQNKSTDLVYLSVGQWIYYIDLSSSEYNVVTNTMWSTFGQWEWAYITTISTIFITYVHFLSSPSVRMAFMMLYILLCSFFQIMMRGEDRVLLHTLMVVNTTTKWNQPTELVGHHGTDVQQLL